MCLHRNWTYNYQAIDDDVVLMGNYVSCKLPRLEALGLKCLVVLRTLTHVRNISKLKENLISLGVLDYKGYKYTCQSGLMKMSKGSLVLLKATKIGL